MLASQGKSVIWKTFLAKSLCFHGKPDKGKTGLAYISFGLPLDVTL